MIFSGHWDHLGRNDAALGPDKIINGAVDNGTGVAQTLELAEKFVHDKRPQRSIAFAFWTLEEQGLLGSEYFAEHPLWPKSHIVGVFNTDADGPSPLSHDMEAPGTGQSELEDVLKKALATQHRVLSPDREPEKGPFLPLGSFQPGETGHSRRSRPAAVTIWWWAAWRRARSCRTIMSITAITSRATNGGWTGT